MFAYKLAHIVIDLLPTPPPLQIILVPEYCRPIVLAHAVYLIPQAACAVFHTKYAMCSWWLKY